MSGKYILDDEGHPLRVENVLEWARWFETAERQIAETRHGDIYISTVFLGLDYSLGLGPPVLWETMIFGGPHDGYQERYTSRADAEAGHSRAVILAGVSVP